MHNIYAEKQTDAQAVDQVHLPGLQSGGEVVAMYVHTRDRETYDNKLP